MKCFKITNWLFGVYLLNLIYIKPQGKLFLVRNRIGVLDVFSHYSSAERN